MKQPLIYVIILFICSIKCIGTEQNNELFDAVVSYTHYFQTNYNDVHHESAFDSTQYRPLDNFLIEWLNKTNNPEVSVSSLDILLSACFYLTQLKEVKITPRNIINLSLVALVLATKFNSDYIFSNQHYAPIGRITAIELKKLECLFLNDLNYQLFIDQKNLIETQKLITSF